MHLWLIWHPSHVKRHTLFCTRQPEVIHKPANVYRDCKEEKKVLLDSVTTQATAFHDNYNL